MMSQVEIWQMFWNDWGNHDLNYYKQYVRYNAITADQFKEITIEYTNKERNKLLSVDYKP